MSLQSGFEGFLAEVNILVNENKNLKGLIFEFMQAGRYTLEELAALSAKWGISFTEKKEEGSAPVATPLAVVPSTDA